MTSKWLVDPDYPGGRLVEMTGAEEAQLASDQAAWAVESAAEARVAAVVAAKLAALVKARKDLSTGVLFASLPAAEKNVIDLLLEATIHA